MKKIVISVIALSCTAMTPLYAAESKIENEQKPKLIMHKVEKGHKPLLPSTHKSALVHHKTQTEQKHLLLKPEHKPLSPHEQRPMHKVQSRHKKLILSAAHEQKGSVILPSHVQYNKHLLCHQHHKFASLRDVETFRPHWYADVFGGFAVPTEMSSADLDSRMYYPGAKYRNSQTMGVSIGRHFFKHVAFDFTLTKPVAFKYYRERFNYYIVNTNTESYTVDTSLSILTAMLNADFIFGKFHNVTPHVNIGAGVNFASAGETLAWQRTSLVPNGKYFSYPGKSNNYFAWGFGGEMEYDLTHNISFSVGYKFMDLNKVALTRDDEDKQYAVRFQTHLGYLGFKYKF